jgi:hypothetical protein
MEKAIKKILKPFPKRVGNRGGGKRIYKIELPINQIRVGNKE